MQNSATLPGTVVATATASHLLHGGGEFSHHVDTCGCAYSWHLLGLGPGATGLHAGGQWFWDDRMVQSNSGPQPGKIRAAASVSAASLGAQDDLSSQLNMAPDQVFRLVGTTGGGGRLRLRRQATPCNAQYTVTQIGGSIVPGTTDIGNHGDDTVTTIALPFPFTLYDQSFTSINLSSNGNAQFVTTDATFTNPCLPWTTHNYTIFPYWDDLYLVNAGFGIFTSISGTAPNRIFNIEWRAQYFPGAALPTSS